MSNLQALYVNHEPFREAAIEYAQAYIGTTSPEFARKWLEAANPLDCESVAPIQGETAENDASKSYIRNFGDDSMEKLDADIADMIGAESLYGTAIKWMRRAFLLGRASLDDEFAEMEAERRNANDELVIAWDAAHDAELEVFELEAKVDEMEADNGVLKHTNAELYNQAESLCAKVDWLEESVDALKGKRDELMDENDYWRNEVHLCLLAACDKNRRGYAPEVMEYPLPDGYTTPSTLVTSEIDHLRDFCADLKKENDMLGAQLDHLPDERDCEICDKTTLLEDIEGLERERDQYHEQVCGLKIELAQVQGNLKNTTHNHAAAKAKYERAVRDAERAEMRQREAERKYAELLEKPPEDAWAERIGMLEAENAELREKLGEAIGHAHEIGKLGDLELKVRVV